MKKWNLIVDVAKCFNCNNCALAVHDEYFDNEFPGYATSMPRLGHRWIDLIQRERGQYPMIDVVTLPVTCNHCDDAPCVKAAQNAAVKKRADGIVVIDPGKARGQRQIVESCPYDAVWWNNEKQVPQAWPFDAHLLDTGWTKTRASQSCPTEAIRTLHVTDDEMRKIAAEERLEVLNPEYGTKPRVYYKNLHRFTQAFVGGSLAGMVDGVDECLAGVTVTLSRGGAMVASAVTDTFGDFRIDRLPKDGAEYVLNIARPGFAAKSVPVTVSDSIYLGVIHLPAQPAAA